MKCLFVCLMGPVMGVTAAAAEPFGDAEWLRHPVFDGHEPLGVFERHGSKEKATPLRNVHVYFRKEIVLPDTPVRAVVRVTGDDTYKLYLNGVFALDGPEPAYPFAHPYSTIDVTGLLTKGSNCLAAHTYYHGVATRAFNSADNRAGFMLALDVEFPDSRMTVGTDASWACIESAAIPHSRMFGYATQFNENIDMRAEPRGWRLAGFDDTAWDKPLVGRQDHTFIASATHPLEHWRAEPAVVKQKGPGRFFYDFGQELVGHTRITVKGEAGHVMTVWHGEELSAPDTVRHEMRCNCDYEDRVRLSGEDDVIEFYDYRAFRYVEILDAPAAPQVWVDVRHYPLDLAAIELDSSDEQLNGIWRMCVEGIRLGCQGVATDCPSREKGQYTGDTYMTVLSQLYLTGDPSLTRKAIRDFQLSQRFDDGLLCVAPGGFRQELAEWSLLWPVMLAYYHEMTGDAALVVEMVEAGALDKLFGWFAAMEGENGLLTGMNKRKWVLVDWPENLRGGYDYDATKDDENAVVNAFYYRALRAAASLMRAAGRPGDAYDARAERVRTAFVERLLDGDTGVFRDGPASAHCSLHASGYALCFGLVPEANLPAVVDLVRTRRLDCGIYGAPYFVEGCYKAREHELAYDLMIASRDTNSWYQMLASGATTTMEAWAPDLKWNTSWCHPAGATPVYLIIRYMLGLRPAEPGWRSVAVDPQLPAGLDWVSLRFPTVAGPIEARYEKGKPYRLTVPADVEVEAGAAAVPVEVVHRGE
ncbi:MAG: family 78 glycoside hydrolase catalytic domain [Candidatus Hydrogenedentes bacterium]|nr:family 78 glycoside hydrolase catalytic domain [Candidatus Hydrogenedentota bacterium]